MPYVNIKESKLVGAIASQVGDVQGILTDKVYDLVNESIQKIRREACPPLPQAQRLQQKVNAVTSTVGSISTKINKFKKIAETIVTLVQVFNAIKLLVLKLPVPQAVPPGVGLPVGFSMVQTDLLHKFKEKIKQSQDDAEGIVEVVKGSAPNLQMYGKILKRINIVTNGCRLEGVLKREVARGRLTNERLEALGILKDGKYLFSELGPNLFEDFDFTRGGDVYENNSVNGTKNKQELADNAENDLLGALQKLDKEGIDIGDIFNAFKGETEDQRLNNPDNFYTAANGEVYELKIRLDKDSPKIAPRRFAVAIDKFGVEILKGPKSFSSDTKILIDELKFRLDNQLP